MHFIYLDETGDESCVGFSALVLPVLSYRDAIAAIKGFRRRLNDSDGIRTTVELHATRFTAGRGRLGMRNARGIRQERRCQIFNEVLDLVAGLPNVSLLNAFRQGRPVEEREQLVERLVNRLQKAMESAGSEAILIFDEGGERWIRRITRRLSVFNPIRSRRGAWEDGSETKNFPTQNLLEDPFFRRSGASYMLQLADFCAYALFQKENPTESRKRFGLDRSFEERLAPVCNTLASSDPYGIIR